jgi:hypothetical protein
VSLRLRLDTTQLPKPLQVNTLVSREWSLASDWCRVVLTPSDDAGLTLRAAEAPAP